MKQFLIRYFPWLGPYKRKWVAFLDASRAAKSSYSQYREDVMIREILQNYNLADARYIDVGANHPTDISNTYLLYRDGMRGIIIEPNAELVSLFKKYRPEDIPLMIGCSNQTAVLPFHISRTPVVSSFKNTRPGTHDKTVFVPVMTLDAALSAFEIPLVSLLSIDVEGLNREVLEGASETLKKSLLVCLEYDTEDEIAGFEKLLGPDFDKIATVHCNLIYLNQRLADQRKKS